MSRWRTSGELKEIKAKLEKAGESSIEGFMINRLMLQLLIEVCDQAIRTEITHEQPQE